MDVIGIYYGLVSTQNLQFLKPLQNIKKLIIFQIPLKLQEKIDYVII